MPSSRLHTALTAMLQGQPALGTRVVAKPDLRVGRGSRVTSSLGLRVEEAVVIGTGCRIDASGSIGAGSTIGRDVRVHGAGTVTLEGDNWVGAGATLVAPVTLEQGAVVAPGAVVSGHVPAMGIASGDPARVIGARFGNDVLREVEQERALSV
jgi:acetyltransferase-like isoleucine patch superfamily enzyme